MFKWILVGGHFSDEEGKPSGYIRKLNVALNEAMPGGTVVNGGSVEDLHKAYRFLGDPEKKEQNFDVIFWFASIDNSKSKRMIRDLKKDFPRAYLVTSKRNYDSEYTIQDLIARMLQNKANLMVEFVQPKDSKGFSGRVLDPLGNTYGQSWSIPHLASILVKRLEALKNFTRIGSKPDLELPEGYTKPEVNKDFLDIVKKRAEEFHEIIHGTNTTRFLGNCSFRCERGFPSFRGDGIIYVSRRNVDKKYIDGDMFVPVDMNPERSHVSYAGDFKPSVDTPIQVALYKWFKHVNYMIHSHCYVKGGTFIEERIPCGSFEEFYAIAEGVTGRHGFSAGNIRVNLKGHGSIVMAANVDFLYESEYYPRPMPEE
jgi:hypothetical protein